MAAENHKKKRRRRRKRKIDRRQRFDSIMIIMAFFISVAALIAMVVYYLNQDTGIGDEQLELRLIGTDMNIAWEDTEAVDFIRLYRENPVTEELELIGDYYDNRTSIENVRSGEELTLKFEPVKVKNIWKYSFELKSRKKSVTIIPKELAVPELSDEIDIDSHEVTVNVPIDDGCVSDIYTLDASDEATYLMSTTEPKVVLTIDEDIAMPERGKPIRLFAKTYLQEENCKQLSADGDRAVGIGNDDFCYGPFQLHHQRRQVPPSAV